MTSVLVARSARDLKMCPRHSSGHRVESCASEKRYTNTAMKFMLLKMHGIYLLAYDSAS